MGKKEKLILSMTQEKLENLVKEHLEFIKKMEAKENYWAKHTKKSSVTEQELSEGMIEFQLHMSKPPNAQDNWKSTISSPEAGPGMGVSDKHCPECSAPMFDIWAEDAYICPSCNMKFTGQYMYLLERSKQQPPPNLPPKAGTAQSRAELKFDLVKLTRECEVLKARFDRLQHRALQMIPVYEAAKNLAELSYAGEETPDEKIEEALTVLLTAITRYEEQSLPGSHGGYTVPVTINWGEV